MATEVASLFASVGLDTKGVDAGQKKISGALGGIGSSFKSFLPAIGIAAAVAGGIALVSKAVGFLGDSVKMAAEEQVGIVKLNQSLKASFEANAAGATKATAAHTVMVAAMKPEKLAALGIEIQKVTARVNDQSAALARSKHPTQSATLALDLNRQKLAALQAQYTQGAGKIAVSVGGVAASAGKLTGTWQEASAEIEKYLRVELKRTALDDGEGRASVQVLTEATGDYRQALKLLPIAQDLARAKGMDLATASQLVGKVSQGNVSILTRYGIVLKKGTTATQALAEVTKRFGGQAAAFAQTEIGASQKLDVAFGNIKESIGAPFLNVLTRAKGKLADFLTDNLPAVETFAGKMAEGIDKAIVSAGKIWDAFNVPGDLSYRFANVALTIADMIGGPDAVTKVSNAIGVLRSLIGDIGKGDWGSAFETVKTQLVTGFNAIWPAVQAAWSGTAGGGLSMEGVGFDFGTVGIKEQLTTAWAGIDWQGMGGTIGTGLKTAFDWAMANGISLTEILATWAESQDVTGGTRSAGEIIGKAIGSAIKDMLSSDATGVELSTGLGTGLAKMVRNVQTIISSISAELVGGIVGGFAEAFGSASAAVQIGDAVASFIKALAPILVPLRGLKGLFEDIIKLKNAALGLASAAGVLSSKPAADIAVRPRARGGDEWVTRPTLFLAGERGPERVQVTPQGQQRGGNTINITINAPGGNQKVVTRAVLSGLAAAGVKA